jgi:hypothetical protein
MKKTNMPGYSTKGTTDAKKVDIGMKSAKKVSAKGCEAKPKKDTIGSPRRK